MRTERQTEMTKLKAAFHNFAKAPKKKSTPSTLDQHGAE
jgi:hypothetical protein